MIERMLKRFADRVGRESWPMRKLSPLYETLLVWRYGNRGMPWEMNGVTYRIDPRQRRRTGEEKVVIEYIRPRLREGSVCFVLGANAGLYVLQLAHLVGPHGRVVAFEPNPTTFEALNRHVAMNGIADRVTTVAAAIGSAPGKATLYAGTYSMLSRLGDRDPGMTEKQFDVEVEITSLDVYCEKNQVKPDWITMDIEGFEFAALDGARKLFRSAGRPLGITAEFHPDLWHLSGYSSEKGEQLLAELGWRVHALTGQADPLREFGLVALEPVGKPGEAS